MNTRATAATDTVCNPELFKFPAVKKRAVSASFTGGDVTSDGGVTLLRQTDRRIGLSQALAKVLPDPRDRDRIEHPLLSLVRQRIYGLCQGYEDLNDHDTLRHDLAWQTAVERDRPLASSPTLCRLENRADRQVAWAGHQVLVEQFIGSFKRPPKELILDSTAPMTGCMGSRKAVSFMATTGTTVSCRSMCSAGSSCWWLTCGPVTLIQPGTLGPC